MGPHEVWVNRHIQEGLSLIAKGNYEKAIKVLQKSHEMPENIYMLAKDLRLGERVFYHIGRCYEKLGQMDEARQYWQEVINMHNPTAWEPAFWYTAWRNRYFQALSHMKLGNDEQANIILDALEIIAKQATRIPHSARRDLMDLVIKGRTAPEDKKDPMIESVEVTTIAEL